MPWAAPAAGISGHFPIKTPARPLPAIASAPPGAVHHGRAPMDRV